MLERESVTELGKDYLEREVGRHATDLSRSGDETELEVNVPETELKLGWEMGES